MIVGARQTMNRTDVATSVFVRAISLMDDVTDTEADDVELRRHWTTRHSLTAVMVVVTAMMVKKSVISIVE